MLRGSPVSGRRPDLLNMKGLLVFATLLAVAFSAETFVGYVDRIVV